MVVHNMTVVHDSSHRSDCASDDSDLISIIDDLESFIVEMESELSDT